MSSPKNSEDHCRTGNYIGIVAGDLQRPSCKIDGLVASRSRIFGPAVIDELHMAGRCESNRRPIVPIDGDRLLEQSQSLENRLLRHGIEDRKRTEVAIVGAEIGGRPGSRTSGFGGLQRRLDHSGDTCSHVVLQFEHVFQ
jgi:hypothetical protein